MISQQMSLQPTPDLLGTMHDVARLVRVEADKRARAFGMTRAQWILLVKLNLHPGLSQSEAAYVLEVEPITVARLVDRLEAKGLVERRADAQDRRIWRLHLLPKAAPLLQDIALLKKQLNSMVTAGIPPAIHEAMLTGFMQMKTNLMKQNQTKAPEQKEVA